MFCVMDGRIGGGCGRLFDKPSVSGKKLDATGRHTKTSTQKRGGNEDRLTAEAMHAKDYIILRCPAG